MSIRNRADVVTIGPTDTVKGAVDRMRAHNIAALVVKSGAEVTGLISDREIVHAVSQHGERALRMAVLEIVTHPKITIAPDDTLKRAGIDSDDFREWLPSQAGRPGRRMQHARHPLLDADEIEKLGARGAGRTALACIAVIAAQQPLTVR